jgi:hypothetical protein
MRRRLTERQAAQLPKFEGTATLVTLRGGARPISSAKVEGALRGVGLRGDEPVFVAVPAVTAEAISFLEELDVVLLREPPQNIVGYPQR